MLFLGVEITNTKVLKTPWPAREFFAVASGSYSLDTGVCSGNYGQLAHKCSAL